MSKRSDEWDVFAKLVHDHINNYTVPQYGDRGSDLCDNYTKEQCFQQVEKYLKRRGKNSRPDQDKLDPIKMAHYIQMGFDLS